MASALITQAPGRLRAPTIFKFAGSMNDIRTGYLQTITSTTGHRSFSHPATAQTPCKGNGSNFQPGNRLIGRTCMVTGGSSGIGFAIAERFLKEGASSVILVGRSLERLQDAANRLGTSTSGPSGLNMATGEMDVQPDEPEKIRLLVGDVAEVASWTQKMEKEMANVDVLVNAAGLSISSLLAKADLNDISQILRTNLESTIINSRAFVRATIRNRVRGRKTDATEPSPPSKCIINISSLLALKAGAGAVTYAASKAGIIGLTRSLALEASISLKDVAIRSNVILPGYIETPMIEDFSPGEVSRLKEMIPLRRFGHPQEVADAAVFLAENEYANNCVLNIDGGLSAV